MPTVVAASQEEPQNERGQQRRQSLTTREATQRNGEEHRKRTIIIGHVINELSELRTRVYLHTGSRLNLITLNAIKRLQQSFHPVPASFCDGRADGSRCTTLGSCRLDVSLSDGGQRSLFVNVKFHVVSRLRGEVSAVLGADFFSRFAKVTMQVAPPSPSGSAVSPKLNALLLGRRVLLPHVVIDKRVLTGACRLDTGLTTNLINRRTAENLNLTVDADGFCRAPSIVYDRVEYREVDFHVRNDLAELLVFGLDFVRRHHRLELKSGGVCDSELRVVALCGEAPAMRRAVSAVTTFIHGLFYPKKDGV